MTQRALETDQNRTSSSSKPAKAGTAVGGVHQPSDSAFDLRTVPQLSRRPNVKRVATLCAAGLTAVVAWVLMVEQPMLASYAAVAAGLALLALAAHQNRKARADTVVLVGRGAMASIIANTLETRPTGRRVVRLLRTNNSADVVGMVRAARCDEVVIAGPAGPVLMNLVDARGKRPAILSGSEKLERLLGRVPLELAQQDKWLARLGHVRSLDPLYARAKRVFDLIFALALGLVIFPLIPLIALAIKLDSPGSVFYSQTRVGLGGKHFRIYKFRTMRHDAEKDGAKWAQARDPRITRLGRFMRSTRFDELPQLWNVAKGDMAVVGPRPERPEFTATLANEFPGYQFRQTVKPGLTGWAQVCYRYTSTIRDTQAKVEYDLFYVKHLSFWFDLTILYRTIWVVLGRQGQ